MAISSFLAHGVDVISAGSSRHTAEGQQPDTYEWTENDV